MKVTEASKEFALKTGISGIFQILFVLMVISNVLLVFRLATTTNTHRETMVPPTIQKTFWVEDSRVSAEYLEQMGAFLVSLAFNNTPVNADFNAKTLLKYVGPASYGKLERYLTANVNQIRKTNTSTIYSVRGISTLAEQNSVSFSGVMTTYIGDKRVSERQKNYTVKFGYDAGKVYILEFNEVDAKDPFKSIPLQPEDEVEEVISNVAPQANNQPKQNQAPSETAQGGSN